MVGLKGHCLQKAEFLTDYDSANRETGWQTSLHTRHYDRWLYIAIENFLGYYELQETSISLPLNVTGIHVV